MGSGYVKPRVPNSYGIVTNRSASDKLIERKEAEGKEEGLHDV